MLEFLVSGGGATVSTGKGLSLDSFRRLAQCLLLPPFLLLSIFLIFITFQEYAILKCARNIAVYALAAEGTAPTSVERRRQANRNPGITMNDKPISPRAER